MNQREKEYESLYKYQFMLSQTAHKAQDLGYKVKMLYDADSKKYSCIVIHSAELPFGAMYISALDFITQKQNPVYRIGTFKFNENDNAVLYEHFDVTSLEREFNYYIELLTVYEHFNAKEKQKVLTFLSATNDFIKWAADMNMKVFIRKYKSTISDSIICTTDF